MGTRGSLPRDKVIQTWRWPLAFIMCQRQTVGQMWVHNIKPLFYGPLTFLKNQVYMVCPESKCFLWTKWQRSTSLMYVGTLVVTLAACPYLFQLDWLCQSYAASVCVWSCFLTSLRLRCKKISNNSTLSNFVWNSTNLPQRHLLL